MTLRPESWTYVVRADMTDEQRQRGAMARNVSSGLLTMGTEQTSGTTTSWTDETQDSVVVTTGLEDEVGSYDRLSMSISNGTRTGLNLFVMPSLPEQLPPMDRARCMLAMLKTAMAVEGGDAALATALPAALRDATGIDSATIALPTPWSGSFTSGDRGRPLARSEAELIDRTAPRTLCAWPMAAGSPMLSFSSVAVTAVMDGEDWPPASVVDLLRCASMHADLIGRLRGSALDAEAGERIEG